MYRNKAKFKVIIMTNYPKKIYSFKLMKYVNKQKNKKILIIMKYNLWRKKKTKIKFIYNVNMQ